MRTNETPFPSQTFFVAENTASSDIVSRLSSSSIINYEQTFVFRTEKKIKHKTRQFVCVNARGSDEVNPESIKRERLHSCRRHHKPSESKWNSESDTMQEVDNKTRRLCAKFTTFCAPHHSTLLSHSVRVSGCVCVCFMHLYYILISCWCLSSIVQPNAV